VAGYRPVQAGAGLDQPNFSLWGGKEGAFSHRHSQSITHGFQAANTGRNISCETLGYSRE